MAAPLVAGQEGPAPQPADSPPLRFEVVSLKPTGETLAPIGGGVSPSQPIRIHGNRMTCKLPLKLLIMESFSLQEWQFDAPEWMMGELFDIQAILPPKPRPLDVRPLLRTMLADRFGLKLHREEKEIPAYALVVGKGGFKLQEASEPSQKAGGTGRSGPWGLTATAMSIASFAQYLRSRAGRPVFDMTGIKGVYDFDLRPAIGPDIDPNREMLALVETQLGLKLEPRKMPVEMFVIDHLDRTPTDN